MIWHRRVSWLPVIRRCLTPQFITAKQAAEKAVKGYLVFCDHAFERIHDVEVLIRTAAGYQPEFVQWIDAGIELTPYARLYRYPGYATEPSREQVDRAIAAAEGVFTFVVSLLPAAMRPA